MKNLLLISILVTLSYSVFPQASVPTNTIISEYNNRINLNGGSISNSDLLAIKSFVDSAKAHLYWDKLIDVGTLAGNNLEAAVVKLKYLGSESILEDNGFTSGDYLADQGFKFSPVKSLNTKTNLNASNLSGLFGFSMWINDGGTCWMGAPNNSTPYSMLLVNPSSVITYIGTPPNFASAGGGIGLEGESFYHAIKQSLNSAKVLVNGTQIGETSSALTTTQLRNSSVEVFRDAGTKGKGLFYCIDNGTLTDRESSVFYNDVKQLMFDLGRKLAPPVISANGLFSQSQTVSITEMPTNSTMSGAVIHYTLDGSIPTTASAIYQTPITVNSTIQIRAIAEKNGKISNPANAWVAIVPEGFNTNKYYTAHVMVNLLSFTNNMEEWLNNMKAAGYNLIWAHLDDYAGNYKTTLQNLMEAANRVGGIQIMPGVSWWVDPQNITQMFQDTWDMPALFKIGGKRIYTGWDYQPGNQNIVDSLLNLHNITKDKYYLWVHSRYPYSYDGGNTWVGEYLSSSGYNNWSSSSTALQLEGVGHLYKTRPQVDGLINFAVDQGSNKNIINTNKFITESSIERGKFSMVGVSAFYASVSFADYGFNGAAEIWDSVLSSPVGSRATAMSDITANDYAELSYISPTVTPSVNGLSFIPPLNSGYTLGNNIRYPVIDHSGIQKFLRPWVEAFKNNMQSPSFTEDRMFAWYWLHPRDQQPSSVIPSIFSGYPHLNQEWWNNTVYATGSINVGGTNQVYGMQGFLSGGMDKIRMAAHLTAPAQLKINNTLSDVMPAGAAYFEIDMGSFRGTPTFSIVRNGVEIKKGEGLQPITNNAFPGGWNFLATEILPGVMPVFTPIGMICQNSTAPLLPSTSNNNITGTWSPATINTAVTGTVTYTFTPSSDSAATFKMDITVSAMVIPTFTPIGPFCQNSTAPPLPASSNSNIAGTWTPASINTSSIGTTSYTFTPSGMCFANNNGHYNCCRSNTSLHTDGTLLPELNCAITSINIKQQYCGDVESSLD
jgi:hypothetical protein